MAKATYYQPGNNIDYTNPGGTEIYAGEIVSLNGERIGVAVSDMAAGETGTIAVTGAFNLPKAAATAIKQGAAVKFDMTAGNVSTSASATVPAGWCVEDAEADDTTVLVKIG